MVKYDLAEGSFSWVADQVQTYGRIGICSTVAVSDVARNGFFVHPKTKNSIENGKRGICFTLSEELQLTDIMVDMADAPHTLESNNKSLDLQHKRKREKE